MRSSRPLPWRRLALLTVLVLAALHGAAWLWATRQLRASYDAWAASARGAGWAVSGDAPVAAGWPLAAELLIPNPSVSGGDWLVPGGVAWRAEAIRLRVAPRRPRTLVVSPEGAQRVRLAAWPEANVTAEALSLAVPLAGDGPAVLDGREVEVSAAGAPVHAEAVRGSFQGSAAHIEAHAISLPRRYAWPLGDVVRAASATIDAAGAPLPSAPGATPAEQAARWRDAGGKLDVPAFALAWGPLGATGAGSGALDASLQPRAQGRVTVTGWSAAIDQLARGGAVTPGAALAARAVLGLFARASDAAPGAVTLPVALADGVVTAGGIPLLRAPPLRWR